MVNNPFLIPTQKETDAIDRDGSFPLGPLILGKDALSEKAGEKSAVQLQGHHALLSILFPYQGFNKVSCVGGRARTFAATVKYHYCLGKGVQNPLNRTWF